MHIVVLANGVTLNALHPAVENLVHVIGILSGSVGLRVNVPNDLKSEQIQLDR